LVFCKSCNNILLKCCVYSNNCRIFHFSSTVKCSALSALVHSYAQLPDGKFVSSSSPASNDLYCYYAMCVCVCQTVRPAVRHVHMTAAAHAVCLELATSVHISTLLHPAVLVSLDLLTLEGKKSPAPYLIIPSPTFYDLLFSHHTSVTDRR